MNVLLAIFLSIGNQTDECVWYFVNVLVDSTIGLFLCFILMFIVDKIARCQNWKVNKEL